MWLWILIGAVAWIVVVAAACCLFAVNRGEEDERRLVA